MEPAKQTPSEVEHAMMALADAAVHFVSAAHAQAHPNSRLAHAREALGPERYSEIVEDAIARATRHGLTYLIRAVPPGQLTEMDSACFYATVVREVSEAVADAAGMEAA